MMKRIAITLIGLVLLTWNIDSASTADLEIQGKRLISQKPPFTLALPSEFSFGHSFSHESPGESSLTRVYFLLKTKGKQVEEMLIVQIADKTNPQAGPMSVTPLKPYAEKRLYSKGKLKKGEIELDHLIQLMAWNPDAPSLQPLEKKGFIIPSSWALQGQFLFLYQGEHAVFFRYSRDIHSFGLKTSEEGKDWEKDSISGNEKRVYEAFHKTFIEMINSIQIRIQ
jgi:hypothetical protein